MLEPSALIPIAVLVAIPAVPFPTVSPFTDKSAENVLAPAIVWAVVLTFHGLVASAGAKLKTPFVMLAPLGVALAIVPTVVEPKVTHAVPL